MFIFYFTESILFHGDVIRDIGEKGERTRRIRSWAQSWRCQPLREKGVPSLGFVIPYGNGQGLFRSVSTDHRHSIADSLCKDWWHSRRPSIRRESLSPEWNAEFSNLWNFYLQVTSCLSEKNLSNIAVDSFLIALVICMVQVVFPAGTYPFLWCFWF